MTLCREIVGMILVFNVLMKKIIRSVLIISICLLLPFAVFAGEKEKVTVFAAASTANALTEIGQRFSEKQMGRFTPSFASSSTLAKQIDRGAPADVYLAANPMWMDFLEKRNRLVQGTRFDLLGNRIVLIAPEEHAVSITITPGFDLAGLLGAQKLAMGDPDHVPAGIYGKKALQSLGVWSAVSAKVARTKDVRAALTLVERAEAPLGIVYATDAAISKKVRVVGVFPENSHPAITYPVAVVADRKTPVSMVFLDFLKSSEAKTIFKRYGFSVR